MVIRLLPPTKAPKVLVTMLAKKMTLSCAISI